MQPISELDAQHLATLTEDERLTLVVLSKGFNVEEVARLMRCHSKTVERHITAIYQKLDVSTRVEAAVIAAKAGLV